MEYFFTCPYCGEEISMTLDFSVAHQEYVEDCEVCCNPIQIIYEHKSGDLELFEAASIEQ